MKKVLTSFAQLKEERDTMIVQSIYEWIEEFPLKPLDKSSVTEQEVDEAIHYISLEFGIKALNFINEQYEYILDWNNRCSYKECGLRKACSHHTEYNDNYFLNINFLEKSCNEGQDDCQETLVFIVNSFKNCVQGTSEYKMKNEEVGENTAIPENFPPDDIPF